MKSFFSLTFMALVFGSPLAAAQIPYYDPVEQQDNYYASRAAIYMSVGSVSLSPEQAHYQGVGENALYLKAGFTSRSNNIIFGAGISGYFYEDYDAFHIEVEDYYGDRWIEGSDASSFNFFGEIGYGIDLSRNLSLDLITGYEWVLVSERAIEDCTECYSEEINFGSGGYFSPRLNYVSDSGFMMGLSYQTFFEDDIQNALSFNIGFSL